MVQIAGDKVAIYIRWSTEDQGLGHTLEIQRESCRYYCLSQGWLPTDELTYIDDGYSGSSLARPAMARLREAVAAGRVDCVVVYKLDRLSRNVTDMLNLVLGEWEERCCVRSTQEPVDTTTDAGRMFFAMLGSFADFERSSIRTRTWSGKRKNAEQGKNPGMVYPYGFARSEAGGWQVVEAEAALVQQIFARYIRGASCRQIAVALNRDGLRTRSGHLWADSDISRILRNPLYAGRLEYNRRAYARRAKLGHVPRKDPAEVIVVEGAAPAIVSPDDWRTAQAIRAGRPRVDRSGGTRALSSPHLLAGLLKCGQCGHSWICVTGGEQHDRYYTCAGARTGGPTVCQSRAVKADLLERFVLATARQTWSLKPPFQSDLLTGAAGERRRALEVQIKALRQRLSCLESAGARFTADYKSGRLPAEVYAGLLVENRNERNELLTLLAEAEATRREAVRSLPDTAAARRLYESLDPWALFSPADLQQVLRFLIREIRVNRPRGSQDLDVELEWRLPRTGGNNHGDSLQSPFPARIPGS